MATSGIWWQVRDWGLGIGKEKELGLFAGGKGEIPLPLAPCSPAPYSPLPYLNNAETMVCLDFILFTLCLKFSHCEF